MLQVPLEIPTAQSLQHILKWKCAWHPACFVVTVNAQGRVYHSAPADYFEDANSYFETHSAVNGTTMCCMQEQEGRQF